MFVFFASISVVLYIKYNVILEHTPFTLKILSNLFINDTLYCSLENLSSVKLIFRRLIIGLQPFS